AGDPDVLLPATFRNLPARVSEPARAEMKEAIDAATGDLKDWSTKLEALRAEQAKATASPTAALRAARDKAFQRLAAVKARNLERAAAAEAKTPEARALAREKRLNAAWEARAEAENLRAQEALIALEARRADLPALNAQVLDAHARLARKT